MNDLRERLAAALHNEGDGGIWEELDRGNSEIVADALLPVVESYVQERLEGCADKAYAAAEANFTTMVASLTAENEQLRAELAEAYTLWTKGIARAVAAERERDERRARVEALLTEPSPPKFDGENYEGRHAGTEHLTVGPHRAWCCQCAEWCWPTDYACPCCEPRIEAHDLRAVAYRLYSRVVRVGGCDEFTGSRKNGYGVIMVGSRTHGRRLVKAHRIAWELAHGPIPDGVSVCHHCDNPACVRLDHLFLGSSTDNAQDMVAKGRARGGIQKGSANGRYKITAADVPVIRARVAAGETTRTVGQDFGIAPGTVSGIARRVIWRWVA